MGMSVSSIDELRALEGHDIGYSSWVEVGQSRIDGFADVTDDHQWIHTDAERAKDGPFGQTVAQGYLTLSLVIPMWSELLNVEGVSTKVNYGLNKVRFPASVPSGSRIRMRASIRHVQEIDKGVQVTVEAVVERDGADRPVCVAEPIFRFYS